MLIVTILPSSYPDQVCIYSAQECKNYIETFYTESLINYLENPDLVGSESEDNKEEDDDPSGVLRQQR